MRAISLAPAASVRSHYMRHVYRHDDADHFWTIGHGSPLPCWPKKPLRSSRAAFSALACQDVTAAPRTRDARDARATRLMDKLRASQFHLHRATMLMSPAFQPFVGCCTFTRFHGQARGDSIGGSCCHRILSSRQHNIRRQQLY